MYFDPGFGSMIIQLLAAGLAGGAAMLGIFRHKIIAIFKKDKSKTMGNTDENTIDKTEESVINE